MKPYIKLLLILAIPLLLIAVYGLSDIVIGPENYELAKADFSELDRIIHPEIAEREKFVADSLRQDSILQEQKRKESEPDTCSQRILYFGDSMVEYTGPRMGDYAKANGHELTSVCWYSSGSKWWSETDTLRHFIKKVDPTFIMVCLGGNEQFTRDLESCDKNIKKIVSEFGDIPFVWICTPSWKGDTGFNAIAEKYAGKKRFYDSRKLTFQRGSDHAHPTKASAREWMDSLAVWLQSPETAHPIRMKAPEPDFNSKHYNVVLSPMKN